MVRIIDVCSGKGGVGKTVVASNLGIALQKLYKRTAVVDFNFTTSHLSLYFDIYSQPITLNNVLRNEARLEDAMYSHASGLKVIPGSLNLKDIVDINVSDLKNKLKEAFSGFDIVLIDSAPGLGKEALIALQASDEILYVANPQIPSVIDIAKCKDVVNKLDNKPSTIGIVVNRVRNRGYEIKNNEITQFTGLPVIGVVPEDEKILECTNKKTLVTVSKQKSSSSKAFFKIAAKIAGVENKEHSFIDSLMKFLGRRKYEN